MTTAKPLVAFGSWRCNCTFLAATLQEVPARCPDHGVELLDAPTWEENPHGVALGLAPDHRLEVADSIRRTHPAPAIRCQHHRGEYPGHVRCTAAATALLVDPDGDEKLSRQCASYYCDEHGTEIATEYLEKLGESWSLQPLEARQ